MVINYYFFYYDFAQGITCDIQFLKWFRPHRFYEWKKDGKKKQPYYVHLEDGRPLVFAALYDSWEDPEGRLLCWNAKWHVVLYEPLFMYG